MSVRTTSGVVGLDHGDEAVEVLAHARDLDVGVDLEQAGDGFAHQVVVLGHDDPDRHGGEANATSIVRPGSLPVDACAPGSRCRRGGAGRVRRDRVRRRRRASAGFSERIVDYHTDVTIEPDGTIEVHETIVYDFGVVPKHGIFRTIPVRTEQSGKDGYDRVYPLDVVSVSGSADTPAQYTVEEDGDNERIKIGDPDRTITGEHTYDIVYRVRGAMNAFADHDELYWNVVGTEWSVPIEQATAVVHAPADITQVACFTGAYGCDLAV